MYGYMAICWYNSGRSQVIPLNTKVYIEFPKGWEHLNGYYKAADTGGAIKGNIVDVFLETDINVDNLVEDRLKYTSIDRYDMGRMVSCPCFIMDKAITRDGGIGE